MDKYASSVPFNLNETKPVKIGSRTIDLKAKAKVRKHRKIVKAQKRHMAA